MDDPKKDEYQDKLTDTSLSPNDAKKMGGKTYFKSKNYSFREKDWDKLKISIMKDIVSEYYKNNPEMAEKLLNTGDKALIHKGFGIDGFWGVTKKDNGNHHGKILMEIREQLNDPKYFEPEPEVEEELEEEEEELEEEEEELEEEEEKESNPGTPRELEEGLGMFVPKSAKDLEEGLKIKWIDDEGNELDGNIDIIDKNMKKNVNIVIYDNLGGEIKLTVPLKDIKIIK